MYKTMGLIMTFSFMCVMYFDHIHFPITLSFSPSSQVPFLCL